MFKNLFNRLFKRQPQDIMCTTRVECIGSPSVVLAEPQLSPMDPWKDLGWKMPTVPVGQTVHLDTGKPFERERLYDGAVVDPYRYPGQTMNLSTGQPYQRERMYDGVFEN